MADEVYKGRVELDLSDIATEAEAVIRRVQGLYEQSLRRSATKNHSPSEARAGLQNVASTVEAALLDVTRQRGQKVGPAAGMDAKEFSNLTRRLRNAPTLIRTANPRGAKARDLRDAVVDLGYPADIKARAKVEGREIWEKLKEDRRAATEAAKSTAARAQAQKKAAKDTEEEAKKSKREAEEQNKADKEITAAKKATAKAAKGAAQKVRTTRQFLTSDSGTFANARDIAAISGSMSKQFPARASSVSQAELKEIRENQKGLEDLKARIAKDREKQEQLLQAQAATIAGRQALSQLTPAQQAAQLRRAAVAQARQNQAILAAAGGAGGGGGGLPAAPAPPGGGPPNNPPNNPLARLMAQAVQAAQERLDAAREAILYERAIAQDAQIQAQAQADLRSLVEKRKALEERTLTEMMLGDDDLIRDRGAAAANRRLLDAREKEAERNALTPDQRDELTTLNAQERANREISAAKEKRISDQIIRAQRSRADDERDAALHVQSERERLERRLRIATLMLGEDQAQLRISRELTALKAQTLDQEARLAQATAAARTVGVGGNTSAAAAITGTPTRFQRMQSAVHAGGRDPLSFQRFGQFMASRALSSAAFAVSGFGIYGAFQQIKDLVNEASELQVQLQLIESQFDAFGASMQESFGDAAVTFEEFREEILSISVATGTAADEAANVARQLAGAFAQDGVPDFARALQDTETAMKIARTTGLPTQEITDSLTAVSLAFDGQAGSFEEIGDLLVGLEGQYGVLGTQLVQFTADLAPLGAELGFSVEQLTALGAVAQQTSGRSGAVIAEQLGRILPSLQGQSAALIELFSANSATADSMTALGQAFAANDIPKALSIIAGEFDSFTEAQRNSLASMVGGRREAAVLFSILTNGRATVKALNETDVSDFAGALEDRFGKTTETVAFSFDKLRRSIEEFGIALFDAGLAEALVTVSDAMSVMFLAIAPLFEMITKFNDALGNTPMGLLTMAAAMAGVGKIAKMAGWTRLAGAMSFGRGGVAAGGAGGGLLGHSAALATRGAGPSVADRLAIGLFDATGKASNLMRGIGRVAPVFLAFEALNSFMSNTASAAEEAQKEADNARRALEEAEERGPEAQRKEIERQQQRASNLQRKRSVGFIDSTNPFARAVNFGAGHIANALGSATLGGDSAMFGNWGFEGAGDAALRAAAGQPQEYETIAQEIAASNTRKYQTLISNLTEFQGGEMIRALKGANLDAIQQAWDGNEGFRTEAVKDFFGSDGKIDTSDINVESIQSLMAAALEGDELAAEVIRLIFDFFNAGGGKEVGRAATEVGDIKGVGDQVSTLDDLKAAYDRGEMTAAEFYAEAQRIAKTMQDASKGLDRTSQTWKDNMDRAREALQAASDVSLDLVTSQGEIDEFVAGVTGKDDGASKARRAADRLKRARDLGVQNEDLGDLARSLVEAEQQAFQDRIDATEDAAEKLRLAQNGFSFSTDARAAIGMMRLAGGDGKEALDRLAQETGLTAEFLSDVIIDGYEQYGRVATESLKQAAIEQAEAAKQVARVRAAAAAVGNAVQAQMQAIGSGILNKKTGGLGSILGGAWQDITAQGQMYADIAKIDEDLANQLAAIDEAGAVLDGVFEVGRGTGDAGVDPQQALSDAKERELAALDLAAAHAGDDQVALASIARQRAAVMHKYAASDAERLQALAQMVQADDQMRQALLNRNVMLRDLVVAQNGDGAISAARAAQANAAEAVAHARTEEERIRAEAEKIRADRAVNDALKDAFDAQIDLLIAVAEANGDGVSSAKLNLQKINDEIARLPQKGLIGEDLKAEQDRLNAERVAAEAAVRDETVSAERELLNYQLEMEEITVGQAIAGLQGLLAVAGTNEDLVRDINLEIKRLRDQAGQDFQFNLPTQLALPTAYEVRRLGQSEAAGMGYNDNRQINVTVNAETNASPDQIAQAVTQAVGDPSRNGTVARKF